MPAVRELGPSIISCACGATERQPFRSGDSRSRTLRGRVTKSVLPEMSRALPPLQRRGCRLTWSEPCGDPPGLNELERSPAHASSAPRRIQRARLRRRHQRLHRGRALNVLLVDDEPDIELRRAMRCATRATVSRSTNGADALDLITTQVVRRHDLRHPTAEAGWPDPVPAHAAGVARHDGDPDDRVRRHPGRRRGGQGRRARLPDQAVRDRRDHVARRAHRRASRAAARARTRARRSWPSMARTRPSSGGRSRCCACSIGSTPSPPATPPCCCRARAAPARSWSPARCTIAGPRRGKAVRRGQLRRVPRHAAGGGAVRARARRVHGRGQAARRALPRRARRHPAAGRGRRDVAARAGQAAARAAGGRHRAARHERIRPCRRAGHLRDPPQPARAGSRTGCSARTCTTA